MMVRHPLEEYSLTSNFSIQLSFIFPQHSVQMYSVVETTSGIFDLLQSGQWNWLACTFPEKFASFMLT